MSEKIDYSVTLTIGEIGSVTLQVYAASPEDANELGWRALDRALDEIGKVAKAATMGDRATADGTDG